MSGTGTVDRSRIETILPLSPVQEALLLATLGARGAHEDPGFLQLRCTLRGDLDESDFRRAWQHVIARHAALRTSVHWEDAARPMQVVHRTVELELVREDGDEARVAEFLAADRARGITLSQPPAMRLALFRAAADARELVWSCHHLLLDGWSGALVLGEVAETYEALRRGSEPRLPPAPSLREYTIWLQSARDETADRFWRDALAGLEHATPLPFDRGRPPGMRTLHHDEHTVHLDADATAGIAAFARKHRITTGTILHGAWALLLAGCGGIEHVCFGTTVSGRAAPVSGIDRLVGTLSNALPVTAQVHPESRPATFLQTLQERLAALQSRAHHAPARIHAASGVPGAERLFESLVVYENFPADVLAADEARLRWEELRGGITSGHALVFVAVPGDRLALTLLHDPERIAAEDARTLLDTLATILRGIVTATDQRIGALLPPRAVRDAPAVASREAPAHGTAPGTDAELRLWKIWERVLGTRAFGVDDDFFDVGGHSLLVARLLAEIETGLGVRMPVATVFRNPTIRALARAVAIAHGANGAGHAAAPRSPHLVELTGRGGAAGPPLFLLHGLRGDVTDCFNLVRHLGTDRAVFGVVAEDRPADTTTIEVLAARYARAILEQQPDGRCFVGGYCFGGTLAYETARQLAASGHAVDRVIVIDGDARMPHWPLTSHWMRAYWNLQLTPRGERAAVFRRKVRKALRRLTGRSARMEDGDGASDLTHGPFLGAYRRYRPQRFAVPVTLILARDDPPGLVRWRRAGWSRLLGDTLDLHEAPGTHYTLMTEPAVRDVASYVQGRLSVTATP